MAKTCTTAEMMPQRTAASRKLNYMLPGLTPLCQPNLDLNGANLSVQGWVLRKLVSIFIRYYNLGTKSKQYPLSWHKRSHPTLYNEKNCAVGHAVQQKIYLHHHTVRNNTIGLACSIFKMFVAARFFADLTVEFASVVSILERLYILDTK